MIGYDMYKHLHHLWWRDFCFTLQLSCVKKSTKTGGFQLNIQVNPTVKKYIDGLCIYLQGDKNGAVHRKAARDFCIHLNSLPRAPKEISSPYIFWVAWTNHNDKWPVMVQVLHDILTHTITVHVVMVTGFLWFKREKHKVQIYINSPAPPL